MPTTTMNMFGAFLLALSCVYSGNTFKMLDSLIPDHPSCEELRTFWNFISHAKIISEYTNKIPTIPWSSPTHFAMERGYIRPMLQTKDFLSNEKINSNRIPSTDFALFSPPPKSDFRYEVQQHHDGFLVDTSQDLLSRKNVHRIVLPDPKRREKSSAIRLDPWSDPYEVGLFGRFVDEVPRQPETKISPNIIGKLLDNRPRQMENSNQVSCVEVENRECSSDLECSCASGSNRMRCHWNKCAYNTGKEENEYGMWHKGALPKNQLGAYYKRWN